MIVLHAVENLQPVQPAALQPDILDHEMRQAGRDNLERLVRVRRHPRAIALIFQNIGDKLPNIRLVIDDQDVMRHE